MTTKMMTFLFILLLLFHLSKGVKNQQELDSKINEHNDKVNAFLVNIIPNLIGAIIFGVLIALCNVAGIGGAGINVCVCIVFFGLTAKQSLAISSFCITIGAFVRYILNFNEKHPFRESKSIDYTIVMMMLPMFLLGSLIGTKISISIPNSLILSFTAIVLFYLSAHTIIIAFDLRRKEINSQASNRKELHVDNNSTTRQSILALKQIPKALGDDEDEAKHIESNDLLSCSDNAKSEEFIFLSHSSQKQEENKERLDRIIQSENSHCKVFPVFIVIVVFLIYLFKGTSKAESPLGVEECSLVDHALSLLFILFLILMSIASILVVKEEHLAKINCGYEYFEGDIIWTSKNIIQMLTFSFFIGLIWIRNHCIRLKNNILRFNIILSS